MSSNALIEFELEDNAGTVFVLGPDTHHALEISGLGMPPIRHWTTRSPFQHGRTHWGYAIQPRIVNLVIALQACGRAGLYAGRMANVAMLNPMNGPHVLRLKVPDEQLVYELHNGWYLGGYELTSTEQGVAGGIWNQTGGVQLEFDDPFWKWVNSPLGAGETRDANGRTCIAMGALTPDPELTLGFTGPFLLGTTVYTATFTATNDGTWEVKPTITVTGPLEDWSLTNSTTGKTMYWDGYNIAAAEVVTIDIPNRSITNGAGTNLSTYLSGDFGTFVLQPGANTIDFWGAGGAAAGTAVSFCWYVEVLGV